MSHAHKLENLITITGKVIKGIPESPDELIDFIRETSTTDSVLSRLAENISMLILQKDVHAHRLEDMIEDFLLAQEKINEARHDPLTGLPNRALFHSLLEEKCHASKETKPIALFFIDLDKFKQINDSMGHDAGDQVLQLATRRIQSCLKDHDILCRLGGDEFTVILTRFKNRKGVNAIAQRIIDKLCMPFKLTNGTGCIGGSIGISFSPSDAESAVSLIKNADIAMYKAKENGRNRYEFYSSEDGKGKPAKETIGYPLVEKQC